MTETIGARVSRIVVGGTHLLLDKAESLAPDAAMAQSIREVDQAIAELRGNIGKIEASKHLLLGQLSRLQTENEALDQQVKLALDGGRDDLATVAIGRQTDIDDLLPVLQQRLAEQSAQGRELEGYIGALHAKRRELEQALQTFLASQATAAAGLAGTDGPLARVAAAEQAFARVLAREGGVAGTVAQPRDVAKLQELADIQRQHRIAERLALVKAELEAR